MTAVAPVYFVCQEGTAGMIWGVQIQPVQKQARKTVGRQLALAVMAWGQTFLTK